MRRRAASQSSSDLAHVVQACADVEVIPLATLKAEGANAVLTDAIVAARAALPVP